MLEELELEELIDEINNVENESQNHQNSVLISNNRILKHATQRSPVWRYYILAEDKKSALCTKCNKSYVYKGSTSPYRNHLRDIHGIVSTVISIFFKLYE